MTLDRVILYIKVVVLDDTQTNLVEFFSFKIIYESKY